MTLRHSLLLAGLLFVSTSTLLAQPGSTPPPGSIGLTASLQGSQFDIMLPWWLGERFVLAPGFGIAWAEGSSTRIALGVTPRLYLRTDPVATYVGARVGAFLSSVEGGSSATDVLVGAALGGEYYLGGFFSLGVESQLNVLFNAESSVAFGNPGGTVLNTATSVFASIYF